MDILIQKNTLIETKKSRDEPIEYSNDYDVDPKIHIAISIIAFFVGILTMSMFWYNRNHYLIRYRSFKSAFIIGCTNVVNMTTIPILWYFKLPCYTNFIVNSACSSITMILMVSRYMKIVILNKQNLMKSNFLDITMKGKDNKKKKDESKSKEKKKDNKDKKKKKDDKKKDKNKDKNNNNNNNINNINNNNLSNSFNIIDIESKNENESENESESENAKKNSNKQVFFIIEPNEYIKHYDELITMKVNNIISAIFFGIIFLLIVVVFLVAWNDLFDKCNSKSWFIFLPVMVATFISSLFNFYCLIYSLKHLSVEKSIDIALSTFGIFAGIIFYILSKSKIIKSNGSSYFFFFPYFFCTVGCIYLPLVEIYWNKFITKKKKVSKNEFIKLLTTKKYIEIIKMYSIKYLCVENILFWELHIKILKNICSELYTEVKNIKTEEPNKQDKLDKLNNSDKLDILDKPIKENKSNVGERRYSTGIIRKSNIIKSGSEYRYGDGNQAFPYINETGDTMNNNNHFSNINSIIRSDNYENPTYFDTLMMENSYNINIFSLNSNSSNIYESDSTGLSTSKSQSIEVKLNIETSDIKKIVFDQIFKELVIPEETWDVMLKRMSNFNENYMEQYKKMYDIYINPKGIVPMKLKGNSVKNIALKVNKSEYSYDMYFPILEDVATLIYDHVYLNLDI